MKLDKFFLKWKSLKTHNFFPGASGEQKQIFIKTKSVETKYFASFCHQKFYIYFVKKNIRLKSSELEEIAEGQNIFPTHMYLD